MGIRAPFYTLDQFGVTNHGDTELPVHFFLSSIGTELKKDAILCSVQASDANFEIIFCRYETKGL